MLNTRYVADFKFLKNPLTKRWVISAPRRAKRPDIAERRIPICPFCNNREKALYQIPNARKGSKKDSSGPEAHQNDSDWQVKVVANKYSFAPIHELVIHSPEHTKNFEKLPIRHVSLIFQAYKNRYNEHSRHGQVYIFHNRGKRAGESLPHPHTQIVVISHEVYLDILPLRSVWERSDLVQGPTFIDHLATEHFVISCPENSAWPDEVWIAPRRENTEFGEITDDEIDDLSHILFSLITIFDLRYEHDFPFNFYIYPGNHWYLRIIPRKKTLGGFEVGTGVMVNTQKPSETMDFIRKHFQKPDIESILREHVADYHQQV